MASNHSGSYPGVYGCLCILQGVCELYIHRFQGLRYYYFEGTNILPATGICGVHGWYDGGTEFLIKLNFN